MDEAIGTPKGSWIWSEQKWTYPNTDNAIDGAIEIQKWMYPAAITTGSSTVELTSNWGSNVSGIILTAASPIKFIPPGQKIGEDMSGVQVIRYTVVDPDPILAEKNPEHSFLTTGVIVTKSKDHQKVIMDLAGRLGDALEAHNRNRVSVEYEDKDDKTRRLKPIKLSDLDIILEVIRAY